MSFALNLEQLSDRPKFTKALVYGESGTGKTVFAGSAPRPILWFDTEGGTNSIADGTDIDIVRADTLDVYREGLNFLRSKEGAKYKSVVLDSFTETQAAVMKEIMTFVTSREANRDEFAPQLQDYQRMTGMTREIVRGFRDLEANVIITALAREDTDELTAKVKVRPRLSPAVADEIPGFMDAVIFAYSTSETNEADDNEEVTINRNFLLQGNGKYLAKVRAPEGTDVPVFIRNAKFDDVATLVTGK